MPTASWLLGLALIVGCERTGGGGAEDARGDDGGTEASAGDAESEAEDQGADGAAGDDSVAEGDGAETGDETDGGTVPDPSCTVDGCLREVTHLGDYTTGDLEPYLDPDVTIDNGYSAYVVRYFTSGEDCLATVTIPFGIDPPAAGYHVVTNEHGTSGVADACAVTGTLAGGGLAGLFGAHGMIGVAPDYPGLGTAGVHPYLVAASEGRSALDALRTARALAGWLGVPISGRYAVAGLSQGGHAALAAAALHSTYAPELDVRAFAASGPATMWEEQWRAGAAVDGPHLVFHALFVWAWAKHYGWTGPELWAPDLTARIDGIMESRCLVSTTGGATLGSELGESAAAIFSPGFLDAYRSGAWGEYAAFHGWFDENRIGPYEQTAPLRIYQGDADDVVPEAWTRAVVDALRAGGVTVEYEVVPGGGHTDVAFGFVAYRQLRTDDSIAWLRSHLDAP
ncbi:MAG: hypothetical protein HY905_12945 [Deltaproteobacteria bacterium]|nr:hypothetical protein [Deltaproteobacteria bacterium]